MKTAITKKKSNYIQSLACIGLHKLINNFSDDNIEQDLDAVVDQLFIAITSNGQSMISFVRWFNFKINLAKMLHI